MSKVIITSVHCDRCGRVIPIPRGLVLLLAFTKTRSHAYWNESQIDLPQKLSNNLCEPCTEDFDAFWAGTPVTELTRVVDDDDDELTHTFYVGETQLEATIHFKVME